VIIVDAHQDLAMNAILFNRDYRLPNIVTRQRDTLEAQQLNGTSLLGFPDAILGRVALVFATLFVAPPDPKTNAWRTIEYTTSAIAYRLAMQQLDHYNRLFDNYPRVRAIRTLADLDAVLATWGPDTTVKDHQLGMVLLMENGDPITEPRQFEEWYGRGVRIVGPAWAATRYCGGTNQPGPLTKLGYELLDVMSSFNAILDVSHMAEEAYYQALDHYHGSIIASHSNPRRFRNTDRHLSDAMIRRLAERDGVMGIVPYNTFLQEGWTKTDARLPISIVADAIDAVCQITGSAAHVGIGTDWDGGFGLRQVPQEFDSIGDLMRIADVLRARGYSAADTEAVLSGNMLRKLRQGLA
jgi:membrane dipeptidase